MIIHEDAQRSEGWFHSRLGKLTGSRAADAFKTNKDGTFAASRKNLRMQLVLERLTGRSQEREFQSQAMKDGIEREVDAQGTYEALTGRLLHTVGFIEHDSLAAGCSLDGYVDDFTGIVEIKSPLPATHLEYLRSGVIPADYQKQIQHALWITGAEWCDWLSYQPLFPEPLRVKLVRVKRDEATMRCHELLVSLFLSEVDHDYTEVAGMVPA